MSQQYGLRKDFVADNQVLSFDGTVLELFLERQNMPLARIHIRHLAVQGYEADKHGQFKYVFSSDPDIVTNKYPIKVPSERNAEMQSFLMALKAEKDRLGSM